MFIKCHILIVTSSHPHHQIINPFLKLAAKYIVCLLFPILSINICYSQSKIDSIFNNSNEIYLRIPFLSNVDIHALTKAISIDHITNGYVYAYTNEKQFNYLLSLKIEYEILTPESAINNLPMCKSLKNLYLWNSYPTYQQYDSLMHSFEINYPGICRLFDIGSSYKGRKIYFLKIADSVDVKIHRPEFMYSSSIHGNELVGYVLMLRFINYLLTNKASNPEIDSLIKNVDIWINPLANPDGAYAVNDSTVNNSTRGNSNGVDLNRNFPDPEDGQHPDGQQWQIENIHMMNFIKQHHFRLSANFHTGEEVVNYPWDTWSHIHADDNWFKWISHQYADTAIFYSNSINQYFHGFDNGISNGYDWYEINGGRQDYVTYFLHGREVTIELFNQNQPNANYIDQLWNANLHSFLNYIKVCKFGIQGTVTDSSSGKPLKAMVEVMNYDDDSSQVFSDSSSGYYQRMIYNGTYNIKFTSPGYKNKIISDVYGFKDKKTILNVELSKDSIIHFPFEIGIYPNIINFLYDSPKIIFELNKNSIINLLIFDKLGNAIYSFEIGSYTKGKHVIPIDLNELNSGIYYCHFKINDSKIVKKIVVVR
jgi:hypothetical protein